MNWLSAGARIAALTIALAAPQAVAIDLQGHRGARGLAPENTLAGFRTALAIGVTTLETDLALTRDGVLVLSHEPRLASALTRGPDGNWLAADGPPFVELDAAKLGGYDVGRLNPASRYAEQWPEQRSSDGEQIPTLASLFALAREARSPGGRPLRFNIETKITPQGEVPTADSARFARAVVDAVKAANMADRVTVQSFDWRSLRALKAIAPAQRTACLTIESDTMNTVLADASGASPWHAGLKLADHGGSLPRMVHAAGCSVWSPFWRNVTTDALDESHRLGLAVIPWTVNDPADMERLLALGVDGLITDYPDRAHAVMQRLGRTVD
jgi:glycerophosphoryl diester phosphodiesterase